MSGQPQVAVAIATPLSPAVQGALSSVVSGDGLEAYDAFCDQYKPYIEMGQTNIRCSKCNLFATESLPNSKCSCSMLFAEIKIRNMQFLRSKEVVDKYNAIKRYVKPAEAGSSSGDAKKVTPAKKTTTLDMRSYLDDDDDACKDMVVEIRKALEKIDADDNGIDEDIAEKFEDILSMVDLHQPLATTVGYIMKMNGRMKRLTENAIAKKVIDAHNYIQTLDDAACKKANLHLSL